MRALRQNNTPSKPKGSNTISRTTAHTPKSRRPQRSPKPAQPTAWHGSMLKEGKQRAILGLRG